MRSLFIGYEFLTCGIDLNSAASFIHWLLKTLSFSNNAHKTSGGLAEGSNENWMFSGKLQTIFFFCSCVYRVWVSNSDLDLVEPQQVLM